MYKQMVRFPRGFKGKKTRSAWYRLQSRNLRRMASRALMRGALTRQIKQPVQYFVRTSYQLAGYSLAGGAAALGAARVFRLSAVPNASEFTNLYDQYQIKGVKISLIPRYTDSTAGLAAQAIGNVWSAIDYDDVQTPVNVETLLQYQNVKRTRMNQVHTRFLKPMIANEVFNTGIATAYAPKRNVWLDCASDTVEHYGIKLWFDSSAAGVTFDVQVKFYLAFKNVR